MLRDDRYVIIILPIESEKKFHNFKKKKYTIVYVILPEEKY